MLFVIVQYLTRTLLPLYSYVTRQWSYNAEVKPPHYMLNNAYSYSQSVSMQLQCILPRRSEIITSYVKQRIHFLAQCISAATMYSSEKKWTKILYVKQRIYLIEHDISGAIMYSSAQKWSHLWSIIYILLQTIPVRTRLFTTQKRSVDRLFTMYRATKWQWEHRLCAIKSNKIDLRIFGIS